MNHPFYLKLVTVAVLVMGFTVAYSVYYMPQLSDPIQYTELDIILNTSRIVYATDEQVEVSIYLRNPYDSTVYVDPFTITLVGFLKEAKMTGIHIAISEPIRGIITLAPLSEAKVSSVLFNVSEIGVFSFSYKGENHVVYVIKGIDKKYWDMKPELIDSLPHDNKKPGVNLAHWFAIAEALRDLQKSESLDYLPDILVNKYPDWRNGTAYIALADTSDEFTQPILEAINSSDREYVRFVKAPTTPWRIQQWENMIIAKWNALEKHGVKLNGFMLSYDGRIMLGIENVNENMIEALVDVLEEIPPGVLMMYEMEPVIAA